MADLHNISSPIAKATAAAPTYIEGDVAGLSQDLSGGLRVSASFSPSGTQDINIKQVQGAVPSATNPIWVAPATASTPWVVTGSGTAGSAATGVVTVQGIASMTPLLINPGTAANWAVGATGSAVPANGSYEGINVAGTLRGWTGVNPSGSVYAGQVDIASIAGTTAVNGSGTSTGALRVELPTNGTGKVGLNAGSAVIGAVSTDQTTPQTTDLITKRYDRAVEVVVNFTQGTTYVLGNSIGATGAGNAKVTLDLSAAFGVSMANKQVKFRSSRLVYTAGTVTAAPQLVLWLFPTNPAGTFTDATVPTLSAADGVILASGISIGTGVPVITLATGAGVAPVSTTSQDVVLTCDGSGRLYLVPQAAGVGTFVTPSGVNIVLEFTN